MCLTSLTTCHSIYATAPHTRRDARYKCFEVANYGGVRTRYTRQLIGGSWWHYRPPRKHNLGGREDVKAHSPRALLLFWHGAAAAVDSAAARAGNTAPTTKDMTYLVQQGVPLRLWPVTRGLAFPIPFLVLFLQMRGGALRTSTPFMTL